MGREKRFDHVCWIDEIIVRRDNERVRELLKCEEIFLMRPQILVTHSDFKTILFKVKQIIGKRVPLDRLIKIKQNL